MPTREDIPRLFPAPFWAAYGALEGSGVGLAELRATIAYDIVAALVDAAEVTAGGSGGSLRLDNTTLPEIVSAISIAHGLGLGYIVQPAVYASARVLTAAS